MTYAPGQLRKILEVIHDTDVMAGKTPFHRVRIDHLAATSRYSEDEVLLCMAQVRTDRATRQPPNSTDDSFEGK